MVVEYYNASHEGRGPERWDIVGNKQLRTPDTLRVYAEPQRQQVSVALEALDLFGRIKAADRKTVTEVLMRVAEAGREGEWVHVEDSVNPELMNTMLQLRLLERHPDGEDLFACTGFGERYLALCGKGTQTTPPPTQD